MHVRSDELYDIINFKNSYKVYFLYPGWACGIVSPSPIMLELCCGAVYCLHDDSLQSRCFNHLIMEM